MIARHEIDWVRRNVRVVFERPGDATYSEIYW